MSKEQELNADVTSSASSAVVTLATPEEPVTWAPLAKGRVTVK